MASQICIYEDANYRNLLPLVYFRPVYELKCGFRTLREKIEQNYKRTEKCLHTRQYLTATLNEKHPDHLINTVESEQILFINGRVLADKTLSKKIPIKGDDAIYTCNDQVVGARLKGENLQIVKDSLEQFINFDLLSPLPKVEINVKMINYPWDLVNNNGEELIQDISSIKIKNQAELKKNIKGVHQINKKKIFIDKNCIIKPNVVLDAENGPIYIGKNVKIFPNVYIQGPAFIGDSSQIKVNAAIYHDTTIGEQCKVGGEIENSIIHAYSNKQHDGFLGHAYLCPWINLGAGTINSDLKNNYGNIKVMLNGESVDSGSQFVGLMMGDHSKTAINTIFNTGSIVGVVSNVFGAGFPRRYLPSFTFGGTDIMRTNGLKQSIEVAEIVMNRRNVKMTDADKQLFENIFEFTKVERAKYLR